MSTNSKLHLEGPGGAYLRVSGDRQDTERQYADLGLFEEKHGVKVAQQHRYEDDMPRDLSDKRPDFQRMLKDVHTGRLRWIWVQRIDRFGFKDEWELAGHLITFRKTGCKLYDFKGDEWTANGLMSFFKAGLAGHESHAEQLEKSFRSLNGMVHKARNGEWQGGPPKLGFDVGCFNRATEEELWRVVWEGREQVGEEMRKGKLRPIYHIRRLKVYPDGNTERLDGEVVFRTSKEAQVMRITPTNDKAKLAAAQGVFKRYATESVSFYQLCRWVNGLGIRNSFGKLFQVTDIQGMLTDESYLGYPTFSKYRTGRFHRHDAEAGITELEPELWGKQTESEPDDIIKSNRRWFEPIVDRETWDAVQKKLRNHSKTKHAPRTPALYLAGLVVCSGCGRPMVARGDLKEYYCNTWGRNRVNGTLPESSCLRNPVKHAFLEEYLHRYLTDVGKRLEVLTQEPNGRHLTDHLAAQGTQAHQAFIDGIERLCNYLSEHHLDEYNSICQEYAERTQEARRDAESGGNGGSLLKKLNGEQLTAILQQREAPPAPSGFVSELLTAYRNNFDADTIAAQIKKLESEHTAMMNRYADLPTPRAKEKAKAELAKLEARIEELEKQGQDMAGVVEQQFRQVLDLQRAVKEAKEALTNEKGEMALRHKAEALRSLLSHIECEFVVTGKYKPGSGKRHNSGPGNAGSRLVSITFLPIVGDPARYAIGDSVGRDYPNHHTAVYRLLRIRYAA